MEQTSPKKTRRGIAAKISMIFGIIIFLLLTSTALLFLTLESRLIDFIIDTHIAKTEKTIDSFGEQQKQALKKKYKLSAAISSTMAAPFLYNFDSNGLLKVFRGYMDMPEIRALEVVDSGGNPFAALWKENGIKVGTKLPDTISIDQALSFQADAVSNDELMGKVQIFYTDEMVVNQIQQDKQAVEKEIAQFRLTIKKRMKKAFVIQSIALFSIVIILVLVLVFSLKIGVTRPIEEVTNGLKDIAKGEGDLTKRLTINKMDEIGELSTWFNSFIEKIQTIIGDVAANAGSLNQSSTDLSAVSQEMASGADQTLQKANAVAKAGEQMNDNIGSVAKSMEESSNNINTISSAAEEMTATISEIAQNTEQAKQITESAVSQTDQASDQMAELDKGARDINQVIESITDISEQVNLLALNATIEAARAGEAGKGFAVVANEIKELARQTARATGDIKEKVTGIQGSSKGTIEAINSITKVVNDVNGIVTTIASAVEEQSTTTSEIATNVAEVSSGISRVNENTAQSSTAASEIVLEIRDVTRAADEMSSSSTKVHTSAGELSTLAEELNEMVSRFKI